MTGLDYYIPPNYVILSQIEEQIFFCHPHKLLSKLANPVFDLLAAVPYLLHFPLPLLFLVYLLATPKKRPYLYQFIWFVGWVNLLGVLFQITFPTAPPWFVDSAVFDEQGNILYNAPVEGGFKRLDRYLGTSIFHGLYSKSPLPFGAYPSLHVALPTVILLTHPWGGWKVGLTHVIWISLSAIYISHHYLIDALGGILLAILVRLAILKVWSPFSEPTNENQISQSKRLDFSYSVPTNYNINV